MCRELQLAYAKRWGGKKRIVLTFQRRVYFWKVMMAFLCFMYLFFSLTMRKKALFGGGGEAVKMPSSEGCSEKRMEQLT